MAKFIKCSCEEVKYFQKKIKNSPINIELVTEVESTREYWYPDNEGTPSIIFHGINSKWIYAKGQEKQRDVDYEKIVTNNF